MKNQPPEPTLAQVGVPEVLNAVAYGAFITDHNRRIIFWSHAAEHITGWQANEVVGRRCSDQMLVHVDRAGHQLCGLQVCPLYRAIVTGEEDRQPLLVFAQHKQGHRIPVEVSVAPLRDQVGQTVGAIEVFRDLTRTVEDLRRAKAIQDHALESKLPPDRRVHFEVSYRPVDLVGGDFYRVQPLDGDRYAIMLADVTGHGLVSALYTLQLRSFWEECQAHLASPVRFVSDLNRRLYRLAKPEGYFATAVYLLLDAASGRLRYVLAGHPAPLLFRFGGAVESLNNRSPAVGLLENATYRETELQLAAGDSLLLFTDGAIDAFNPQGEVLGEAGLLRLLLGLRDLDMDLPRIERRLLEFTNRLSLTEDLTLLSVRLSDSSRAGGRL